MNTIRYYAGLFLVWMTGLVGRLTGGVKGPFGFAGALAILIVPWLTLTCILFGCAFAFGGLLDWLIRCTGHAPAIYRALGGLGQARDALSLGRLWGWAAAHVRAGSAAVATWFQHRHTLGGR